MQLLLLAARRPHGCLWQQKGVQRGIFALDNGSAHASKAKHRLSIRDRASPWLGVMLIDRLIDCSKFLVENRLFDHKR